MTADYAALHPGYAPGTAVTAASGARWPSRSAARGWRPFTSQSNARGTSGTRPGKCWAISAGGVPTVSDARQTTTPPLWLNFCEREPRRALGGGLEEQMRAAGIQCDQARELRIAGHRAQPLIGPPLEAVAEKMRDRGSGQGVGDLAAAGPGQEQRGRNRSEGWCDDRDHPDRAQQALAPQMHEVAGRNDHCRRPDISNATPGPPTTRSRLKTPEIRLPASAGAMAKT